MKLTDALGPLKDIYNNCEVHEIILDSFDDVYYEHKGQIVEAMNLFKSQDEVEKLVDNLLTFGKISKDQKIYQYDFTLDKRTRVNIVLPPMSTKGPALNLMKIPSQSLGWDELINFKAIKPEGRDQIEKLIKNNKSIIVAGNAGSGRMTLLNILASSIDNDNRVVSLERVPSLILERKRLAKLMAPNNKAEHMPMLVEAASKMRADYIILSNFEGPEAMSFIDLVREGHNSIASIYGENIFDALKNLELKCQISNFGRSLEDIRYAISNAFNYIVFQERLDNGARVVSRIAKIDFEDGSFKFEVLYKDQ